MPDYSQKTVVTYGFIALFIGIAVGILLTNALQLTLPNSGLVPASKVPAFTCYRYVGTEVKDAFCDGQANLHFYYEGDGKLLQPDWYTSANSPECKPCYSRN